MTFPSATSAQLASADTRWAKALSHPVRAHALRVLTERVASPSDIARELGLPVANVSYHVNTLLRLGCIEEVEHRHVRGSIEHLYRALRRPHVGGAEWDALPAAVQDTFIRTWLDVVFGDLRDAVENGYLGGQPEQHLTRVPLRLDVQAFDELRERLNDVLDWAMGLQAEAAARLADNRAGGAEITTRLIMAEFGRPAADS